MSQQSSNSNRPLQLSARWIWPVQHVTIPWNQYALFRRQITLPERPRSAVARVSADARYALFVNAQPVHFGPARSFQRHQCVDELELAEFLTPGENVIAVIGHQYGVPTFQTTFRDISGLIFDCTIETPAGSIDLSTPTGWKCRMAGGWKRDTARMSIQMGFQEHFDATRDPPNWMLASFQPTAEAGWHTPADLGPFNTHPFLNPRVRAVPRLVSEPARFAALVGTFRGHNARGWRVAEDVCRLLEAEPVRKADRGIEQPAAMLDDDDSCATVPPPPDGQFVAAVLDLGGYRTGHLVIDIAEAAGDEVIDIVYAESLEKSGFVHFSTRVGCGASCATRYRCRPGPQRWETFAFVGMQYVAVVFRGVRRPLRVRFIGLRRVMADVPRGGEFQCSDDRLNRIWRLCQETQIACLLDVFVDCPWREQAMWWGDARVQALVTAHAFGDCSILEHGIRLVAESQADDGSLHAHPPSDIPGHRLPDFMLTWVGTIWDHYWLTGRIDLIQDCLPAVHRLFDFFGRHARPDGLIGGFDGWWVFLDWCDLHKSDYSAVLNLLCLQAVRQAADLCRVAGDRRGEERYREWARILQRACVSCFWDARAGLFKDGNDPRSGKPIDKVSQHANALAILLDLQPEHHTVIARDALLKPARQKKPTVITASPFFYAYVLDALCRVGARSEAIELIRDKWGAWLDQGAVSCWETWPPSTFSRCHAWSASPLYHLMRQILGITAAAPAFGRARIAPLPMTLDFARGAVPTPMGLIRVEWERADTDQLAVRLEIPPGIDAEFVGPTGASRVLRAGTHEFQT